VAVAAPQSRWARFFLTQPAKSVRKRVFKGLFYFFFGIAMLALPLGWTALFADSPTEAAWFWVAYFVSYFGLALLFRLGAR
jgi:cytochrome c biogenesis protein CcdA